jgi:hypothetical protein
MFNAPKIDSQKSFNPPYWFKILLLLLGVAWVMIELINGSLFFAIAAGLLVTLASFELKKEVKKAAEDSNSEE